MGDPVETTIMKPAFGTLRIYDDLDTLSHGAAEFLCDMAGRKQGPFRVALSGGHTPKPMYELLAQDPIRHQLPWERVHWILGDERFVPPTSPDSNYRMAREAFLDHVPVPPENVHPVETEGVSLDEAASKYEDMLKSLYGADKLRMDRPLLDLTLLGLGPDGHTASLLPGQPVLKEQKRWVAPVPHGRPQKRVSLTYPALDSSRVVAFVVSGEEKRDMLDRILSGDTSVPAAHIRPIGDVLWFVDRAAAGRWT